MLASILGIGLHSLATSQGPMASEQSEGVWVTAEGTVPFAEEMTMSDVKSRSRNEARRRAVEQAVGLFITGSTVVYNYVLAEDIVQPVARGLIIEEDILKEGIQETGQGGGPKVLMYTTRLNAKVKRVTLNSTAQFKLQGTLNRTRFEEEEELEIRVVSPRNAYLYIFNVGQDQSVTALFPNQFAQDNHVLATRSSFFLTANFELSAFI